jgi:hypothetical protein
LKTKNFVVDGGEKSFAHIQASHVSTAVITAGVRLAQLMATIITLKQIKRDSEAQRKIAIVASVIRAEEILRGVAPRCRYIEHQKKNAIRAFDSDRLIGR